MPDLATFAAEVKARLRTDRALQASYTFLERRQEIAAPIDRIGLFESVTGGGPARYEPIELARLGAS